MSMADIMLILTLIGISAIVFTFAYENKILKTVLKATLSGAIFFSFTWIVGVFFVAGLSAPWSGIEVFMLTPAFAIFGALIGMIIGMIIGLFKSKQAA